MHLPNGLNRIQMIDPWIQSDLVEQHHPRRLRLRIRIEHAHGGADVAGRDDVRALRDDGRVVGVELEGNDEVVCGDVCG